MTPAPLKPTVEMADLERLDIRVGGIRAAERIDGSKKLVRLTVDFGDHTRRILSGMRLERPDLSELIGKQALFVVNLAPRQMAGEISEGMLFDIGAADGILPALAVPERAMPEGARAG
ncbi:MAG: tRNA-binding protein [Acidobacteriota bacterium]